MNADNEQKISHLKALQNLGDLKILRADLTDEGSFDPAVEGCDLVFLVATPVDFASQDPEVPKQTNTKKLPLFFYINTIGWSNAKWKANEILT